MLREEAGDLLPHIATGGAAGAALIWRLLMSVLVILRTIFAGALLFGLAGLAYGLYVNGVAIEDGLAIHTLDPDVIWTGLLGLAIGGALGFLWGLRRALGVLFPGAG